MLTKPRELALVPPRAAAYAAPADDRLPDPDLEFDHDPGAEPAPLGLGHPILGDVLYGPQPHTGDAAPRLMLHASLLSFNDPATGERITVRSAPEF